MSNAPSVLRLPQDQGDLPILDIVYPDTNFILALLFKNDTKHKSAEGLFYHLIYGNSKIKYLLSTLVVDEFWGILLRNLYKKETNQSLSYSELKGAKEVIPKYADKLREYTKKLFEFPLIEPISISKSLNNDALENMIKFNLTPRDSFHLTAANSKHANAIITNDIDFESIESNTVEIIIKY